MSSTYLRLVTHPFLESDKLELLLGIHIHPPKHIMFIVTGSEKKTSAMTDAVYGNYTNMVVALSAPGCQ